MRHSGAITLTACLLGCQHLVPIVIPREQPAVVNMADFGGTLYFPGFVTEHAELNRLLVRALQFEFRQRGYAVVQGELSQWPAWDRLYVQDFEGQSALVVTGVFKVSPYTSSGTRTSVREEFDPFGRRSTAEVRRYREDAGWMLAGYLVFFDHDRSFLRSPRFNFVISQPVERGPIALEAAVQVFCQQDLVPGILSSIAPTYVPVERTFILDAPAP